MASEDDLRCPVCKGVFVDPVFLSCSHSLCRVCVQNWWKQRPLRDCPLCRTVSSTDSPPSNLVLKNLCEAFLLEKDRKASESLCSLHPEEKLKLFCLDHQETVCLVCRDSERHEGHSFRPLEEAAREPRRKLLEHLEELKEKAKLSEARRERLDQIRGYIWAQIHHIESEIKDQFEKFRQVLEREERARLWAVKKEKHEKIQRVNEMLDAVIREDDALSEAVRVAEDKLREGNVKFLQNYRAAEEREEQCFHVEEPQLSEDALIQTAKHLGNLSFNIWMKMKDLVSYSPVILDPNTAGPNFYLSVDLTGGGGRWDYPLPDNPERLVVPYSVLGSVGFDSGVHIWDVEVRDSKDWSVGVFAESGPRKGDIEAAVWRIRLQNGQYRAYSPITPTTLLSLKEQLQRVTMKLAWTRGRLTFYDTDTKTHIHTFKYTFTEKMFPFFGGALRIKILPKTIQLEM